MILDYGFGTMTATTYDVGTTPLCPGCDVGTKLRLT